MQIIKLNATDSTNAYLKQLLPDNALEDFAVVVAEEQLKGRGQMGTKWISDSGKNLTFSVLKKGESLRVANQFALNMCTSLAIYEALSALGVPNLSVKWPNDILSANSKICGILIENILLGSKIKTSIIGIGLNVNQTSFYNLPDVSSLRLEMGVTFDLDEVLKLIIAKLRKYLTKEFLSHTAELTSKYEKIMFRIDKPSTFKDKEGNYFMGFIKGVSPSGKLIVMLEDQLLQEYDLKEIQLMY
ncbi:biotin--[acetyl-CoA-carboxylase] ligase [Cellulophaga sp. F20128]|uniref:biotin--[acetyl-CoA-carboxylase] ligase n=1 Tax=Cellulophaga sp. F20128 TaxID=2926413 RepID=UPI001FF16D51|nr:biotin--[acetyl-CoA-carboxylase] ligase [Cellulophaga sp. F20128]MCK0158436.1 biotin--[acetyl-CoA-carboxylase] ligase [Cellulophaga sp. F20128]